MTIASRPMSLVFGVVLAACGFAVSALAQNARPSAAPAANPDTEQLPERDVRAIQDALIWTGDYAGIVNGNLGTRTRDAMAAYLKRVGAAGGSFDAAGRNRLLSEAQAKRQSVGFAPVVDKRAGLSLGLPMKLLVKETATESGTRFSSADGGIVVDTLARPAGPGGLPDLFTRMSAASGARKVGYKLLRPDFFVVSGDMGDRSFYSRFAQGKVAGADVVRGFTVTYPKAAAARFDPMALAIAASFEPFPAAANPTPSVAAAPPRTASAPTPANSAPPGPTSTTLEAVLVGPGLVLSRVSHATCASPRLAGTAVQYRLEDEGSGLALLTASGRTGTPVPVSQGPVREGASLFALFYGASGQPEKTGALLVGPVEVRQAAQGEPAPFIVSAPLQGNSGTAPVFDRSGALVGITERNDKLPPSVAGTVPEASYRVTSAAAIRSLLDRAGVAGTAPAAERDLSLADAVSGLQPSMVGLSCTVAKAAAP